MLTDEQRRAFHDDGFVALAGAVSRADVTRMRERIWRRLEHRAARGRDGRGPRVTAARPALHPVGASRDQDAEAVARGLRPKHPAVPCPERPERHRAQGLLAIHGAQLEAEA